MSAPENLPLSHLVPPHAREADSGQSRPPAPVRTGRPPARGLFRRCLACGRAYTRHRRPGMAAYCSRRCYIAAMRARGMIRSCAQCGGRFMAPRRRSSPQARFCSRDCYRQHLRLPLNHCLRCGRPTRNPAFCSRACHGRWRAERSWDRYREHGLPESIRCPACLNRRPSAEFLLPDGQLAGRCAACRQTHRPLARTARPQAAQYPCRDCGRPSANRLYCPQCLHRREHGGE